MEDRRQILEKIGKALRSLRTQKNLSIEQVSAETGIDARTIASYEKGQRVIDLAHLSILYDCLDDGQVSKEEMLSFFKD